MQKNALASLDALRGFGAVLVMLHHADALAGPLAPSAGYLAVDLFFIMSGFVIARAYRPRFENGMSAREFMIARLIRLYPLYLAGALLALGGAALGLANEKFHLGAALWSLTMAPQFSAAPGAYLYPYLGVAWTLALELLVNLFYAMTWRYWTPRVILTIICAAAVLIVAATVMRGDANFGWTWRNVAGGASRMAFAFPLGVLFAQWHARGVWKWRAPLSLIMLAMLVVFYGPWRAKAPVAFDLTIILIVMPIAVACAIGQEPHAALRPLALGAGAVSYAVYALHLPIIDALHCLLKDPPDAAAIALTWAVCGAIIAFAAFMDARWDMPIRARLTQWARAFNPPQLGSTHRAGSVLR